MSEAAAVCLGGMRGAGFVGGCGVLPALGAVSRRRAGGVCHGAAGAAASVARVPAGFRPKQSLGQNFLVDGDMAARIAAAFADARASACPHARVVEVGPGTGALTRELLPRFPDMRALELDQRAVALLRDTLPDLRVDRADVLRVDWRALARGYADPTGAAPDGKHLLAQAGDQEDAAQSVAVVGNLPYNIVSQIMFSLFEAPAPSVALAVVMMQREVAERVIAVPRTKAYGILSVVSQLYARPEMLFGVPATAFSPRPSVESTMVRFDFKPHPDLDVYNTTLTGGLRNVVRAAFQQRRKTLRNSLRRLCEEHAVELPELVAGMRAEELSPPEFIKLTKYVMARELRDPVMVNQADAESRPDTVWRSAVGRQGA